MPKQYLTDCNLVTAQTLWQALYQILSIILPKEFVKLNINTDTLIKKYETCGIKYKVCNCVFEYINFKDDLIEYKCLFCNKDSQKKGLMKT